MKNMKSKVNFVNKGIDLSNVKSSIPKRTKINHKALNLNYVMAHMNRYGIMPINLVTNGLNAVGTNGCGNCLGLIWVSHAAVLAAHIAPPDNAFGGAWFTNQYGELLVALIDSFIENQPLLAGPPQIVCVFSPTNNTRNAGLIALRQLVAQHGAGADMVQDFNREGMCVHGNNLELATVPMEIEEGINSNSFVVYENIDLAGL